MMHDSLMWFMSLCYHHHHHHIIKTANIVSLSRQVIGYACPELLPKEAKQMKNEKIFKNGKNENEDVIYLSKY